MIRSAGEAGGSSLSKSLPVYYCEQARKLTGVKLIRPNLAV